VAKNKAQAAQQEVLGEGVHAACATAAAALQSQEHML
jgi:hypothetical protein